MLLDPTLSLKSQVVLVARSIFFQLWLICQLWLLLGRNDLAIVLHVLVTCMLDYCNAFCMGLPLKTTQKFQMVQNAVARLQAVVPFRTFITPVLKQLHCLPIHFQFQFQWLMLVLKALWLFKAYELAKWNIKWACF